MNNNNVLVTGANGFVGSALLTRLVEEAGCNKIIAMHRSELTPKLKNRYGTAVQWLKADLTTDDLAAAVAGIDTVFHLAAYASISESDVERNLMEAVNVVGTQRLATAAKQAGVGHFIFVSSIAACESGLTWPINEENGFPVSAYGKSKKSAEDCLTALSGNGFEVTVLRPTALFGENHLGSVYELVKAIKRGHFVLFGGGDNRTNFYYIEDFIDVLMTVRHDARSYGQVFITADQPWPLRELTACITIALKQRRSIPKIPLLLGYWLAAGFDMASAALRKPLPLSKRRFRAMTRDMAYSDQKLAKAFGITPRHGLVDGINYTVKWYREQGLI